MRVRAPVTMAGTAACLAAMILSIAPVLSTATGAPAVHAVSDTEAKLQAHLETAAAGTRLVPPRVPAVPASRSSTQVAIGIFMHSLHDIDVVSGVVDVTVWKRM